ncbi:MAG: hypothetical protein HYY04_02835 [Chloroflexi bacterium]|nr:hypothetical protein [Chloroflexota bacterium]
MSEYQYYEFQAIDRPLTKDDMAELRALTTRAIITPTRLQNVYHWGSFRGDPNALMERYFDAFLYLANWGTHRLMLRLPRRLLDLETTAAYCRCDRALARAAGDHVILEFRSELDEGAWVEDGEGEAWMSSLVPLRAEIASGDMRALYLGWLLCAETGELDDNEAEPPVAPGLGRLSGSLQTFADFLRIDPDLIAVAAQRSEDLQEVPPLRRELERWIGDLPEAEKNGLVLRLAAGGEPVSLLQTEILRRFRQATAAARPLAPSGAGARRTVAELMSAAEERADARRREEAEREARERARREREEAVARAAYLDDLAGREQAAWLQVEALIGKRQAAPYDEAVQLLKDLRDLSARKQTAPAFAARLSQLRAQHAKKSGFLSRIERAGVI